ncbi:DUF6343 family protein [Streptomyces sp. NBC_01594]
MLVGEAIAMRTGNEPMTARSPLRLRLCLSLWGMAWALFGLTAFSLVDRPGWAVACGLLLLLTLVDLAVIVHHIHQGPHYQPGRNIPPYEPDHGGHRRYGH